MQAQRLLVPLALLAWIGPADGAQRRVPRVRLDPIALTGEPAPGVGTPFADFSTPFGFVDTTAPTLDRAGNAGVVAHVVDPADPQSTLSGLWKRVGGELRLLALEGEPAPGTGEDFQHFPHQYFETPPSLSAGLASFSASTATSQSDVWTDRNGFLELVVRDRDPLPPGGPDGESFYHPGGTLFADGSMLVSSRWSTWSGDEGFWRDRTGTLELLVRAGSPAPGRPGAVFADSDSLHLQGPFDQTDFDADGRIAFNGTVAGTGVSRLNDEGIWIESATAGLQLALSERDPAPQVHPNFRFGFGSGTRAFGGSEHTWIRRNDRGSILFGAGVHGGSYDYVKTLWRRLADGTLELIAAAEEPWSGFPGTLQPGTGAPFKTFLQHASINASDRIAFQDVIPHPLNGPYNLETGIFWDARGQLELLITTEVWIPGLHPNELINSLRLRELLDDGSLFATADLKDGPNGAERALLFFQPDGSPSVLIREGQTVDLSGDGGDLRTISELGVGGFDQHRRFGVRLVFTDGSSGLFRLELLRPSRPQRR